MVRKRNYKQSQDNKRIIFLSICFILLFIAFPVIIIAVSQKQNTQVQADSTFQPTAPYYATYFYPWSQNPNTDGRWSYWNDLSHTPPQNWFSNYLPDPNPTVFDPATELYSSSNDAIIYWQLQKMAEAKQEVAITSWWGQNHKSDVAFRKIITDVMNRPDNPYPNLRWAFYYEKEGDKDPTVEEIVSDINYIKANYANQPGLLKINNLPVFFVYAGASDSANMALRWTQAKQQTPFYSCLKVYGGYAADPNQPDCWHQYAPAARAQNFSPHYMDVSPGFWKDGEAVRLGRDLQAFRSAVQTMVAGTATWKVITTWNEWGEGSSVEPGEQVIQTKTGAAIPDPNGVPFKNQYIDALSELLPPLEQGLGVPTVTPTTEPTNTPTPIPPTLTPLPTATPIPPTLTPLPTAIPTPALVTYTLTTTADTYVDSSNKSRNYGTTSSVFADNSPTKTSYLKFNLSSLSGKTITSAKLRVYVSNDASPATQRIKTVSNTSWSETSTTYNNRPSLGTTIATISSGNRVNSWVEIAVTSGVVGKQGQVISLGIDSSSSDGVSFSSRETVNKPTLVIQAK